MTVTVMRGDARSLALADDSVDLIVTSPPYFGLRSYQDGGQHYAGQVGAEATPAEFVDALIEVTRECMRVLKPSGSMWINLGDKYSGAQQQSSGRESSVSSSDYWKRTNPKVTGVKAKSLYGIPWRYALRCIDDLGLILRSEVIWSKPNGLPESVTDRVRRSHEQWFHFTLQPRYFSAVDEIREPHQSGAHGAARAARTDRRSVEAARFVAGTTRELPAQPGDATAFHPLGKLPGSVWTVATEPLRVPEHLGVDHFAAFPSEWPRRIILAWSPSGAVVLDPFGGTGTTAHVASALGRHGISVDLSADYCRLASDHEMQQMRRRKVLALPKPAPAPPSSHLSIFDDETEAL